MRQTPTKTDDLVAPQNRSLWRFIYASRQSTDEQAFRAHYLADDVRQLTAIILFAVGFMFFLSVIDIVNSELDPIPDGLLIRVGFMIAGLLTLGVVRFVMQPWVVDIGAVFYGSVLAVGLLYFHSTGDVGITRIAVVVTLFIFAIHLAFSTYALYLLVPTIIQILGDGYLMFSSTEAEFVDIRLVVMSVFITSACMAIIGSALVQRSRYHAFVAMQQVKTLSGLIPICASCKKIRNDDGFYQQIEQYIREHSEAEFTHGFCPDCAKNYR